MFQGGYKTKSVLDRNPYCVRVFALQLMSFMELLKFCFTRLLLRRKNSLDTCCAILPLNVGPLRILSSQIFTSYYNGGGLTI